MYHLFPFFPFSFPFLLSSFFHVWLKMPSFLKAMIMLLKVFKSGIWYFIWIRIYSFNRVLLVVCHIWRVQFYGLFCCYSSLLPCGEALPCNKMRNQNSSLIKFSKHYPYDTGQITFCSNLYFSLLVIFNLIVG